MKNWPTKKLGEVCEAHSGRWGEDAEIPGSKPMRVLTVGNITNDGYILDDQAAIRYFTKHDSNAIAHEGDLLVVKSSGSAANIRSGKTGICPRELDGQVACSNFIMRLVPNRKKVEPVLLWHILNSASAKEFIRDIAGSSTYPNIKWKEYQNLEIPLPPLDEQRRIVGRLEGQMKEVEKMRAVVEARIAAARALPSSFLRSVFNSPESQTWPRMSLRNLLIENGQYGLSAKASYGEEGLPMLRMGNILTTGRIDWNDVKNVSLPDQEMSSYLLSCGDILFNRTNSAELVGKTAVFDGVQPAVFASYLVRFRADSEKADARFVTAYINSEFGRRFIEQRMARAVGQVNISASTMHTMPIPTPPISDQHRIVARLDEQMAHANALIRALEYEREAIAALPAALLREVFG